MKKKYQVTFYYHTSATVVVTAKDEEEAIAEASIEVGDKKYDAQIVHNVTEDDAPDVEEIEK
jgi:hypothetical protein